MRRAILCSSFLLAVLAAEAAGQLLIVNNNTLNLVVPAESLSPVTQSVTVTSSGANLTFVTSLRYITLTDGWLSAEPASGTTPANVNITVNPTGLSTATHIGMVVFTGPDGRQTAVTVNLSVGGAPNLYSLAAMPATMSFVGQAGMSQIPSQVLSIGGANGASTAFTVTASTTTGGNWLSVSPLSGITPANLTVSANQAGLAQGTYQGTIALQPAAGGSPAYVQVTMYANGGGGAALYLSQSSLAFHYQLGAAAPGVQAVTVSSSTAGTTYTASTATPWLRLTSTYNPTPATAVTGLTGSSLGVLVDPSGLASGQHSGSVTVTASGVSQTLAVTLTVGDNPFLAAQPASLSFYYQAGQVSLPSQTITITSTGASQAFTASASSGTGWLYVNPSSGSTSSSNVLNVGVNPVGLTSGTHTGTVIVAPQNSTAVLQIPVTLTVSGSSVGTVTPTSLAFTAQAGGAPQSQAVYISASGSTSFNASATSAGGWLSVSPAYGSAPGSVMVTATPAVATTAGTYTGSVTIALMPSGIQEIVSVTLTVTGSPLSIRPSALSFQQTAGGTPAQAQTIFVDGTGAAGFTVSTSAAWLAVSPRSGNTPASLSVSASAAGLSAGTYEALITVTGSSNQVSIPVAFTVQAAPHPTVSPASLSFTYNLAGTMPASQSVEVGSSGAQTAFSATATTKSGGSWLGISQNATTTPARLTVSVNPAGLAHGSYAGTITVTGTGAAGAPRTVEVTLTVVAPPQPSIRAILNAASRAPTQLSPGLIIVINGVNFGTGARVLFDRESAPVLSARADQILTVVPYSVYGRSSTRLVVDYQGVQSDPIDMRVADAAPGVFTADGAGQGQGAILNEDGTPNGTGNRAALGSIVALYATGEGQTTPAGQDGVLSLPLRRPLLPVSARVDGHPAEVVYAGSVPGLISGAFQVNLRIPPGVEPGTIASIDIRVGDALSQAGVTIAIK